MIDNKYIEEKKFKVKFLEHKYTSEILTWINQVCMFEFYMFEWLLKEENDIICLDDYSGDGGHDFMIQYKKLVFICYLLIEILT